MHAMFFPSMSSGPVRLLFSPSESAACERFTFGSGFPGSTFPVSIF
jgi:hypothetical protein